MTDKLCPCTFVSINGVASCGVHNTAMRHTPAGWACPVSAWMFPFGTALPHVYRIVNTDNFGGDYPNESFAEGEFESQDAAERKAEELNMKFSGDRAPRYFKVVEMPYTLQPGFEP